MPQYRVYFVGRTGQSSVRPEALDCVDDAEAKTKARQLIDGDDVELWEGARLVELFPHK